MINLIIADDHQMFIDGLRALLHHKKNISIAGQAINGSEVLQILERQSVDIVLMDINMPVMDGLEATRLIHANYPNVKVLMLTMYKTREHIAKMIAAGASGYILKNTGKDNLLKAIETLMRGENYFSEEVTAQIMESLKPKRDQRFNSPLELTPREIEVLKLIAQELTAQEIADKLFISQNTVDTHRKNLISKLNVRNTAGLVKYAVQNGLLD